MNKSEHEQNLELARQIKQAYDDMQIVADELRKLPNGQYKKLWENEALKAIWERYGVI